MSKVVSSPVPGLRLHSVLSSLYPILDKQNLAAQEWELVTHHPDLSETGLERGPREL